MNDTPFSRRGFLWTSIKGAIGATAFGAAWPARASAQRTLPFPDTPDAALQELIDGNKRFVDKRLTSLDADLAILKQNTVEKQEPFAAVLSCADSRVPVELLFDQTIGHLFVVRVAGNIATSELIASLEYGAAVLGTKVILVLGHGSCGAVKATIDGKPVPGQISQLFAPLRPAVDAARNNLDVARFRRSIVASNDTAERGYGDRNTRDSHDDSETGGTHDDRESVGRAQRETARQL